MFVFFSFFKQSVVVCYFSTILPVLTNYGASPLSSFLSLSTALYISDREAQVNKKGYNREYSVNVYHNIKSIGVFTSQLMKKTKKKQTLFYL